MLYGAAQPQPASPSHNDMTNATMEAKEPAVEEHAEIHEALRSGDAELPAD